METIEREMKEKHVDYLQEKKVVADAFYALCELNERRGISWAELQPIRDALCSYNVLLDVFDEKN